MESTAERAQLSNSLANGKLVSLLIEEDSSKHLNLVERSEVQDLHSSLVFLGLLLIDIHEKSAHSKPVQSWLEEIKQVYDRIEDVASVYARRVLKRRNPQGIANFFDKISTTTTTSRNINSSVEKIKSSVFEIQETRRRYHPCSVRADSRRFSPRFDAPFLEECLVGIDQARNELLQRLTGGESGLSLITIVGAAGAGKTALAKIVFYDETVTRSFDFRSWVTVGRSSDVKNTLKAILAEEISNAALNGHLRQKLMTKRYVLVFDDVWGEDFLKAVKDVLPENGNGSRIIVTTRSETVVSSCHLLGFAETIDHRIEPLSEAMSRELFCRIGFQSDPELRCPTELEQICEEFIGFCEGSPLAIVTLAGQLLSTSRTESEWRKVLESSFDVLSEHNVFETMACSFDDLSYQLKLCFLCFAVFPRGSTIPYEKILDLWIAEGFVVEEAAEEHLNALVRRNLVKICEGFYGVEKFCRVSVLTHEMARREALRLGFSVIHCENKTDLFYDQNIPRLSISGNVSKDIFVSYNADRIRSVFLFNFAPQSIGGVSSFLATICNEFKLLTMLVCENVPVEEIPYQVGNLFYLKHLSLKNTLVKKLPRFIKNLSNLQTLDVRNTLITELPVEIYKLEKLQQLLVSTYEDKIRLYCARGVRVKPGIGKLRNLQTLMTVAEHNPGSSVGFTEELASLTKLRRLGISRLTGQGSSALCASIEKMTCLTHLTLHLKDRSRESLNLGSIAAPPSLLEHLVLKGRLWNFPVWVSSLRNLTMACLSFSGLVNDPLVHFSRLPNLVSLWLYRAFDGDRLHFLGGGFRALRLLVLRELLGLEILIIEDNSLPNLEELRIGPSPRLRELPDEIQGMSRLKSLALYDMPREFVLELQPDGGSQYHKIDKIFSVQFWFREKGREYVYYELGEFGLADHLQGDDCDEQSVQMSFSYSDDPGDETDYSVSGSSFHGRPSFSSDLVSNFTDDIED